MESYKIEEIPPLERSTVDKIEKTYRSASINLTVPLLLGIPSVRMATSNNKVHKVGVLLYTGADILDFSGPLEILANAQYNTDIENPELVFKPITIARYVWCRKKFISQPLPPRLLSDLRPWSRYVIPLAPCSVYKCLRTMFTDLMNV